MKHFTVDECKLRGCLNNLKGKCTLDKLPIATFAEPLAYFQDATICIVRQQINVYRTENLIENKS
jgi:hypothetical protein|tara:strand:+ start:248 stop:442 length:195 start_codon:yes stop_codon:yes gene_type:complete